MDKPKYKRVLVKLSGEALMAGGSEIIDKNFLKNICGVIKECVDMGTQVAIVVGAGNIWRGRSGGGMDPTRADHMGMLATTINAIAIQDTLIGIGAKAKVFTAASMPTFATPYTRDAVDAALNDGTIVVFGCGLGSPFFSTDTAAVLRAVEIGADAALFAKNIDGVYTADPKVDPTATKYDTLAYEVILRDRLKAIDLTAAAFALDRDLPVYVFALDDPENIIRAANGENIGTVLHGGNN
jgi:uridylate kinase